MMVNSLPMISIVIPTYNRPERLVQCLQAIAHLDYPRDRFEVVVVDDGSTPPVIEQLDRSAESSLTDRLSLTVVRQSNAGPATARNRGAQAATGDYLAFTDDDCQPTPGWLQAIATVLQSSPHALIGGHTRNALVDNIYASASQLLIDFLYDYYNVKPQQARFFASNNMAIPARAFTDIGQFDTSFPLAAGEDRDLCDRWTGSDRPTIYAPEACVDHAHPLTLRRFWRQHFNYGRGAYHFHQSRARRLQQQIEVEPKTFYWRLLTYPVGRTNRPRAAGMVGLMALTQIANVVGFGWERWQYSWPQRAPTSTTQARS